jgi:hypothetical protein
LRFNGNNSIFVHLKHFYYVGNKLRVDFLFEKTHRNNIQMAKSTSISESQ